VLSRRAALIGVAYAFGVTMIGTTLPTPLYPIYEQQFHFSDLVVTLVFAAYGFGVLATLILLGPMSDVYGRRRLLLPGLAVAAISSVVFLLAQGLPLLFVGRVLSGISAGIFTGTATAALLDLAPPEKRDRATLLATVVNIGGLGLGPLLAGALAEVASNPLRAPYAVHLGLLIPAIPAIALMPETVETAAKADAPPPRFRFSVPAEVRGTFIRASAAAFAAFATLGLFSAVAPAFLGKVLGHHNHALIGSVAFLAFGASAIGQVSLGLFSPRRSLPIGCALMVAGMALIAAALADRSLALLLAGAAVAGFGNGLSFRAGLAGINEQAPPEERGAVNSTFFVVAYLAISVPVIGVGVLANAIGLRDAGLVFSACVAVIALGVLLSIVSSSRHARRPDTPRTAATEGSTDSP
jgi:MFS family permease